MCNIKKLTVAALVAILWCAVPNNNVSAQNPEDLLSAAVSKPSRLTITNLIKGTDSLILLYDGNPVFYAQRAIDLCKKYNYRKELGYAYLVMGESQSWYAHDVKRAASFYDSAIASAKFSGDFTVQGRALYGLSVLYQQVVGREGAKRKVYEACKTLELGDAEGK